MPRIELDQVSLTFKVRPHGRITLKELLVRHLFRKSINRMINVHALKDVSLQVGGGTGWGSSATTARAKAR